MPELPEVETTLRGLTPRLQGNTIINVVVRCQKLRWPISEQFATRLLHQSIQHLSRRGKYILIHLERDTLLIHLGMSGRLCVLTKPKPAEKHDHIDILFADQTILRYTDPRRFGTMLLTSGSPIEHPLLKHLGVEPLSPDFTANYLLQYVKNRRVAMKPLLMNSKMVVGVGNIYATEALFLARVHPMMPAGNLTEEQAIALVNTVQQVLSTAIEKGGTTLKDFVNSEGKPGYFSQQLNVYGRAGKPCVACGVPLESCSLGQRTTVYCPNCQLL